MKNTFKKSIAIIISILMIVSSLPFATMSASAKDYSDSDIANLTASINKIINQSNAKTATKTFSFTNDSNGGNYVTANYCKNLLYVKENTFHQSQLDSDKILLETYTPTTVIMYDGKNTCMIPLFIKAKKSDKSTYHVYSFRLNNISGFTLASDDGSAQWHGQNGNTDSNMNWIWTMNGSQRVESNGSTSGKCMGFYRTTLGSYKVGSMASTLKLNSNYMSDTVGSKDVTLDWERKTGTSTSSISTRTQKEDRANIYVVNYKPIYDRVNSGTTAWKTEVNNIMNNATNYTNNSLGVYYDSVLAIMNFDPNSSTYDYANKISDAVTNCGKDIQSKITTYNSALSNLQCTVTLNYKNYNGEGPQTKSLDVKVNRGPGNLKNDINTNFQYLNSKDKFLGYDNETKKATYETYAWPTLQTVTSNVTYDEVATTVDCDPVNQGYTPHKGDEQGYTSYCDSTHSDFTWQVKTGVNWQDLDSQISSAEAIKGIENYDTIYNETSRNTLNTAYTTATTLSNGETADTTQDEVDSANSALEIAIKKMVLQYNIKFVRNDQTLSETYYDINTPAESIVIPELTADHFNGKNETDNGATYTTYFWNPTVSTVTDTATYTENSKVVDCTPVVKEYTPHTSTSNGVITYKDSLHADDDTFTWTVDSDVDWSAYDSAITVSELMAQDTKKYTTDSISTFNETVENNKIAEDQNTTQQQVETATNNILSAQENLELNKFTVTFNCQYDDQSGSTSGVIDSIETPTDGKYSYGTTITLKLPESFANDGVVQKWTLTNKDKTIQYSSCSTTVSYVVTQDCEFLANVTKAPQDPTESAKVEIKNKNDKVTDIQYVKTEEEYPVTIADRVITINTDKDTQTTSDTDVTMTAPKYPYYKVSGFKIGGEVVKENDKIKYISTKNHETGEVTTTAQIIRDNEIIEIADTTIKPIYEVDTEATKIIIKNIGENPFTVKVANQETTLEQNGTLECEWDKKVVVHADDAKVWYDGDKIVGYGDTYTFQSNVAVNLRYTTEEKTVDPSTSIESFTYDLYNDKTVAIVGSYILPENATKKEMGVILSTKVSAQDQIISLGKKYVLTKETDNHQFFFTISRTANTPFTMYAVSYVTYELPNGETKTVYSTVNTCTYIPDAQ